MKSLSLAAVAALLVLGACSSSPTASATADAPRRNETVTEPGEWGGALGSGTMNADPIPGDTLPGDEDNGGGFMGGGNRTGG